MIIERKGKPNTLTFCEPVNFFIGVNNVYFSSYWGEIIRKGPQLSYQQTLIFYTFYFLYKKTKTTFDNGSLGSRNDEERSELR